MDKNNPTQECTNELLYTTVNEHFQIVEELMKMLLIQNVLDEEEVKRINGAIADQMKQELLKIGVTDYQLLDFCGKQTLVIAPDEPVKITRIRTIKREVKQLFCNVEPVFLFEKINGKRKKIFEREKISYSIQGMDTHIF